MLLITKILIPGFVIFKMALNPSTAALFNCPTEPRKFKLTNIIVPLVFWGAIFGFTQSKTEFIFLSITALGAFQISSILNVIKAYCEHSGLEHIDNYQMRSRSTEFTGSNLIFPFNIALHFEHHLNMKVVWYRLAQYRRHLKNLAVEQNAYQ